MEFRLASTRSAAFATIVTLVPLSLAPQANAASESYCNWYATKAVAAYNKAKSKKCGYSGPA